MDVAGKPNLAEQITGAFAWWHEAGVDADFTPEAQSWLAPASDDLAAEPPTAAAAVASPAVPLPPPPIPLPQTLDAFVTWWMSDADLPGEPALRVPPRSAAPAKTMVLVTMPEPGDAENLLAGKQGKLLDAILSASGWTAGETYVAAALPAYDPVPDWAGLTQTRLGEALRHHVSLVAPERVLVLGDNILTLIGHVMANKPTFLPDVNHEPRRFPVLADFDLGALLAQPRLKAGLWRRLLEWTGSETS